MISALPKQQETEMPIGEYRALLLVQYVCPANHRRSWLLSEPVQSEMRHRIKCFLAHFLDAVFHTSPRKTVFGERGIVRQLIFFSAFRRERARYWYIFPGPRAAQKNGRETVLATSNKKNVPLEKLRTLIDCALNAGWQGLFGFSVGSWTE